MFSFLLLIEVLGSPQIRAQVTPDRTLGNENSTVNVMDALNERIDGGARRGGNLFHSFQEFNINEGRGVYFANPQGVMNIFSRVTGGNPSNILGKLGVLGGSNLFFLNPYGIIFGPNASLDIRGSFVGSTASGIRFGESGYFSATDIQGSSLLSVNPGVLISNQLGGALVNRGNLIVGKDLTLSAGSLDLQGQLIAGGNLTLEALNHIVIRDNAINPFIAATSGQLLIQGNQGIDIFILNHRASGLFSGGDLILRSANTVGGDAHYWSGGSFRVEKLDGSLGDLFSPHDPVIRANGDVSLDSYEGASLHIFAGGSVMIPGTVLITEVDSAENSIVETVTLSDGTTVVIDGSAEPTLDIRAGTLAVGSPIEVNNPTSADISIGSTRVFDAVNGTGGKVFLTNQYQPNTSVIDKSGITVGSIDTRDVLRGGSVVIDARSGINLTGILNASALNLANPSDVLPTYLSNVFPFCYLGNSGDVTLLAKGDIVLSQGSGIGANGLLGGNIVLSSEGNISIIGNPLTSHTYSGVADTIGGGINITAKTLSLTNGSQLLANGFVEGDTGAIRITSSDTISLSGANNQKLPSVISSEVFGRKGNSGGIEITTGSLYLDDGAALSAGTYGFGDAGAIKITASDTVSLAGKSNGFQLNFVTISAITSSTIASVVTPTAEGDSGGIEIITGTLLLNDGAIISNNTYGFGNSGVIKIRANNAIFLSGGRNKRSPNDRGFPSSITSEVDVPATGTSGGIEITTGSLYLDDGATISATTYGLGDAGAIKITASDTIFLKGESDGIRLNFSTIYGSTIASIVTPIAKGNAGGIEIVIGSLSLNDGARIFTNTFGRGNSGGIKITARNAISLSGADSRRSISSNISSSIEETAEGDSGGIEISAGSLSITDGALITAITQGKGSGGNINIRADIIHLQNDGDITTNVVSGTGDGGNITLNANVILAFNDSDILAFAQDGIGGNITLNTPIFFGNGYQTTTDNQAPDTLDNNGRVDINASGAVSGVISIPNLTFIQNSLFELPETLINTENLIANSCVVPNQQQAGTFIITGSDGLPIRPGNPLTSPYPTGTIETIPPASNSPPPSKIEEPQGFYRLSNSQMVLSTKCF